MNGWLPGKPFNFTALVRYHFLSAQDYEIITDMFMAARNREINP